MNLKKILMINKIGRLKYMESISRFLRNRDFVERKNRLEEVDTLKKVTQIHMQSPNLAVAFATVIICLLIVIILYRIPIYSTEASIEMFSKSISLGDFQDT